ncbi:MAG: CoA transferase [Elusimicrobia bacterium]|nr:CoA transferase [Elusimicrobiota bacterium]
MPPILRGLRIVEISAFVAAPLAGSTLADLGAEVVRVDPPGGGIDSHRWPLHDGQSLYRAGLDQGKRSVVLDTRTERGQRIATGLIVHAGAVLTNLPAREWSSYERLSQQRPDLIMAVITGNPNGSTAVDYTVNAAVGFPYVTGPETWEGPVNHVLPAWDLLTGYLVAAGMIAAELHRASTGEGQLVKVSLADVALSVAGHLGLIAEAQLNEEPRGRYGNHLYGSYSGDFPTADGRRLIVVALTARQWTSLVDALGAADEVRALEQRLGMDLHDEGARFRARGEISAVIEPWIARRPLAEVGRIFDEHGVLWGPYQTFKQLLREDARCSAANPLFADIERPDIGRWLHAASPLVFGRAGRRHPAAAPALGADTREVLQSWLDMPDGDIARLAKARVVGVGQA